MWDDMGWDGMGWGDTTRLGEAGWGGFFFMGWDGMGGRYL